MTHVDDAPFLLIVGCPRSGTSLLAGELAHRYDLVIPFETHFIPIFKHWLGLYGDLSQPNKRRKLLGDIYLFTRMWLRASKTYDQEKLARISILSTEVQSEQIIKRSHDYASLCAAIFNAYAQQHGAARFADKSVFYSPVAIDKLRNALENIKVINIVRDGRDVYLSWSKTWFGAGSVAEAASLWAAHVNNADDWAVEYPGDVLSVRYEDLLTSPDEVCAAIAKFGGLPPCIGELDRNKSRLAEAMSSAREHNMLGQSINPKNLNKFASQMSQQSERLFADIAHTELARHGYEVIQPRGHSVSVLFKAKDWLQGIFRAAMRWPIWILKYWLPMIFVCGGRPIGRYLTRKIN